MVETLIIGDEKFKPVEERTHKKSGQVSYRMLGNKGHEVLYTESKTGIKIVLVPNPSPDFVIKSLRWKSENSKGNQG